MKLIKIIDQITDIVKKYQLTPTQFRYVCSQVRLNTNLVISKRAKKLPDYLSAAEIYTLLNIAMDDPLDGLLIEFLIFTGLRISEASKLMIQDLDYNSNQLKVVSGKGNKDRYVPLTNNIIHKIKLYLNGRTRGQLFSKTNDTMFTTRALQKRIKKRIDQAEFNKYLTTHSLRHTFACLCLARGMSIYDIKLLMGHTSIKTTEIYIHLELGHVKEHFLQLMDKRG